MTDTLKALFANRRWRYGVILIALFAGMAALAHWIAPYDPTTQLGLSQQWQAPSAAHPFGTDLYGRDVLSRVMHGARISLVIAAFSVLLSISIGTCLGVVAGYCGSVVDAVTMRAVDAALAIPRVFLLVLVLAFWHGVGVVGLVVILGVTSWFGVSRIVRAEVLAIREREYIVAARSLGVGHRRILFHHVLPNVVAPVIVAATLGMGQIILIEAGLSFLGLGVQEPTASLGRMIGAGSGELLAKPWTTLFPGVVVILIVIGFSLMGDGFRNTMDPRTR